MEDSEWTPAELHCRHLLVCRHVWYDAERPEEGFSLGKVLATVRASAENPFPIRVPRLFVYAQLFGTPDEYTLRVVLHRLEPTGIGDEMEPTFTREFGPWDILIPGEEYVESFAFQLNKVSFPEPVVYEFQLLADGVQPDELLAAERILVRNPT